MVMALSVVFELVPCRGLSPQVKPQL